ncbi:hypothetical protein [Paenibacillus ehimensis]|uniref:Transposase n=1 Tax=Paenibacillus ehimensis TaxID=79264 RepID=A0ABT8V5M3_9BACL|nr:hypothetical protein [Paenibacillus ehimensis]MDO3676752.1 hypothetical protein [Paenibacillus ehimensis]
MFNFLHNFAAQRKNRPWVWTVVFVIAMRQDGDDEGLFAITAG